MRLADEEADVMAAFDKSDPASLTLLAHSELARGAALSLLGRDGEPHLAFQACLCRFELAGTVDGIIAAQA